MSIAEVSRKYGLSIDTLRYYERMGLIPQVPRGKNGNREYGDEQCRWIEQIKYMRATGIPIKTLAGYVALCQQANSAGEKRQLLLQQRERILTRIEELQLMLRQLEAAIAQHGQDIAPSFQD